MLQGSRSKAVHAQAEVAEIKLELSDIREKLSEQRVLLAEVKADSKNILRNIEDLKQRAQTVKHLPSIWALIAAVIACSISGNDKTATVVTDKKKSRWMRLSNNARDGGLKQTFQAARQDLHTKTKKARKEDGRRTPKNCRIGRCFNVGDHASAEADTKEWAADSWVRTGVRLLALFVGAGIGFGISLTSMGATAGASGASIKCNHRCGTEKEK